MHRTGRNEMAATINALKSGAAIHHHEAKTTGVRKLPSLFQHSPRKQRPSFSALRRHDVRHEILFGQLMAAAKDFPEALTTASAFDH